MTLEELDIAIASKKIDIQALNTDLQGFVAQKQKILLQTDLDNLLAEQAKIVNNADAPI